MKLLFKLFFFFISLIISILLLVFILKPVFVSNYIIFPYSIQKINICEKIPILWYNIKLVYIFFYFISSIIISQIIFNRFFKNLNFNEKTESKKKSHNKKLFLKIGYNEKNQEIKVTENGLYQNFLILGTTGSGKTSSAIYPFTKQLISYNPKMSVLILDVKGNFYKKVIEFCNKYNRINDLIIIEMNGKYTYNPLDKPNLSANILANRLRIILELFSENNSDSYWLDKSEQVICEAIKICRIYNNGYVNFLELHKLITDKEYYYQKTSVIKNKFIKNLLSENQVYDILTALKFFENEFFKLDIKVFSILKSEITRITNAFITNLDVLNTFSPEKNKKLNFSGFENVIYNHKIVVLNLNIAKYTNLSKIIATYLKLDFQNEVLQNLEKYKIYRTAFICDEYHEYASKTDANFFALSREAKCINIIATQSYTSILNTLKNEYATKVIIQNLINKIWFRMDDIYTIEEVQKQIGKNDKLKISKNISENLNDANYSYLIRILRSNTRSFTEGISSYVQNEYIYDTKVFSRELKTFEAIAFLSNGSEIFYSSKIFLIPYFNS